MKKMIKSIIESKKVFIGLEDSKRSWKLCVRSEGIVIQETSMPARYEVLRNYLCNSFPGCEIGVIYETGFKGFSLHDKLVADGYNCIVTPAHTVVAEKSNTVKCDKKDARRLALNLEKGDYTVCDVPDKELREDRQISRTLIQVQKEITRCKNRIRKFFDFHGYDETFAAGRWYERDYRALTVESLSEPLAYCFNLYRKQLAVLLDMKRDLRKKLRELSKKQRYNRLFTIFYSAPGVGWFTAIRLVLEWGDNLERFVKSKKFASFTGLTCKESSSGDTIHRGRINRQGKAHVRGWLIECAWTAYKRDPVLLHKFQAVYRATSSKKKAVVAVARKLAVRLWTLGIKNELYEFGIVK